MIRWIKRLVVITCVALAGLMLLLTALYAYLSRTSSELISSGETRGYVLYVPDSYKPAVAAPLVISLHGAWLYPGMQKRLTGWNDLADRNGIIVVYPRASGFPRVWRLKPGPELDTEQAFFADLIDEISSRYNIDPARIYVNGYSNGAAMTFMLSCAPDARIAAFGMVATPVVSWDWCRNPRPVPMIAFHGTADRFAPYTGGENFLTTEPLPSIETWFLRWGERNQCGDAPTVTPLADDLTLRAHDHCAQEATALLYTLLGSGHIWPGGLQLPEVGTGPYSDSIHATEAMWEFFQRHRLKAAADSRSTFPVQ